MQGLLKLHAVLTNPEGVWDEELPTNCPPGKEKSAIFQMLGLINNTGGLALINSDTDIEFIPMTRVKSLRVTYCSVVGADLGDLSQLPPPPGGLIHL